MHSLRTRITFVTVCLIVIAVGIVTVLSVVFIQRDERMENDQLLLLLCETGEHNLDNYFNSVQKAVEKAARFVENDLERVEPGRLQDHVDRVRRRFEELAYKTNGVLTYYYRIDPDISDTVKGFWYTNLTGEDFVEREVTDITIYDTADTSRLVWFTVPRETGAPVWLPPYVTENLNMRVISFNVPVYRRGVFVGVVGIEIDYSTMAEQVESLRLYRNGYAFLSDARGRLFYHPRIDVTQLAPEDMPETPEGLFSESTFVRYTYEGVEKMGAWLPLSNGMRLVMTLPLSESDGNWGKLFILISIVSVGVLLTLSLFTLWYTGRITRPLEELTQAAEQADNDDYDFTLDYDRDDELGRLSATFKRLSDHMKAHINDLNKRVYVDALTSVKNKGAFTDAIEALQKQIDLGVWTTAFAVGVFDCNDLKRVNDAYGHEKGDQYLKTNCRLICKVFQHSPVYRIGGDEFAVILKNGDYENREALIRQFEASLKEINAHTDNIWEQISVAMGIADYDPDTDRTALEVVRRADNRMYSNKRMQKDST